MHKIIPLISNFLYNKNMSPSMKGVTCSLNEFDEKPNHTKISKSSNFQKKRLQNKGLIF